MQIPEQFIAECNRFKLVVAARRTEVERLELFAKLMVSDKFSESAKPYCVAILVDEVVARMPPERLPQLYEAMAKSRAANTIRSRLTQDEYETVFGKVVRKALEHAPIDLSLADVFDNIERSGISYDDGQTVSIAIFSGMDSTRLDDICNMLMDNFYPTRLGRQRLVPQAAAA